MSKDYYNILGVNKNASQEEIKKAFRKKAHVYHPDKVTGDEAKFKEVNEAYQVLGNEQKRAQYDQFGSDFTNGMAGGFSGGGFGGFFLGGVHVDMDDLGDIFGGIGDMFGFGGSRSENGPRARRGNDIQTILTIDFKEAVFGAEKEISLHKKVKCSHCNGNLAEPGSKIITCSNCRGTGKVTRVQRTILGNMQVQSACDQCGGEGRSYEKKCTQCSGRGVNMDTVRLQVKIPAGINDGESIRLVGQGEAGGRGAAAGDLYIKMNIKDDPRFERGGYDIHSGGNIRLKQAVLGDKIDIDTVEGVVSLKIPAGTQSGTIFKLRNKGINVLQGRGRGDHLVEIRVNIPSRITRKQKKLIEELGL